MTVKIITDSMADLSDELQGRRPDLFLWIAQGYRMPGIDGTPVPVPVREGTPTSGGEGAPRPASGCESSPMPVSNTNDPKDAAVEQNPASAAVPAVTMAVEADRDRIASVASGPVADFRAETAPRPIPTIAGAAARADSTLPDLDPEVRNPLIPSPAEPATCTCRLYGPQDVLESYLDAVEAVRAIFGPERPAWWCLEVMILYVRRDWAVQNKHARRNTEHYDIYERDGFRCTTPGCTSRSGLHAHHLDFASNGGSDEPHNLTTLCSSCHLFALHREGLLRACGRAPDRITWEMGQETMPDGRTRPRRTYLGEFRTDTA